MTFSTPPAPPPRPPRRPAISYALRGAWLCHTGKLRHMNEDACLAAGAFSGESSAAPAPVNAASGPWIVAVSDGIGGHQGGEEASRAVVHALAECARLTPAGIRDVLRRLNRELCLRGRRDPELEGMGATVAALVCGSRGLFACNVGDSRVYCLAAGKLKQVTRDDSEAQELIDMGLLSRAGETRPGNLHALTQAVGGRVEHVEIIVHTHPLAPAQITRFLICSDGLTDMVPTEAIEAALVARTAPEAAASRLFDLAMEGGGADNITLAVIDVEPVPARSPRRGSARS